MNRGAAFNWVEPNATIDCHENKNTCFVIHEKTGGPDVLNVNVRIYCCSNTMDLISRQTTATRLKVSSDVHRGRSFSPEPIETHQKLRQKSMTERFGGSISNLS